MSKAYKFLLVLIAGTMLIGNEALATHIRAGEISAKRISASSLKYRFTFIGYRDNGGDVIFGDGDVDFGDGSPTIKLGDLADPEIVGVNGTTERWTYIWEYTYSGAPGTYIISLRERDRNEEILNVLPQTPFYIETQISAFQSIGLNQSPDLLIPPIDFGCVDVAFIHNPGAFDPEGDSISYSLRVPLQAKDLEVVNYSFPDNIKYYPADEYDDELGNTPARLTLDPVTGDLVWDAPGTPGEYNVAFRITEWRKIDGVYRQIGYVTRDMQILIVDDCNNERPELEIPKDTCVVAGSLLIEDIIGSDVDNDPVKLEAFSGVFEFQQAFLRATFGPTTFQPQPATSRFEWQTDCAHVRAQPYAVQFKVTDEPPGSGSFQPPSLVDFKTWLITVVGPAPELQSAATSSSRSITLDWAAYDCEAEAESMQVWRRVDSFEFEPANCQVGIPDNSGYELVTTLPIDITNFTDNNTGDVLDPGANYCYRLVAVFVSPSGQSLSYASNEMCATILADAPVMTNVSVEKTDQSDGEIFVRWTSPFSIDVVNFPPPYTYDVYRSVGFEESAPSVEVLLSTTDTSFVDTGLNTQDNIYNYRVYLFDLNGDSVDVSAVASSVRLEPSPGFESVTLNWEANVPWSNAVQDSPYHYVYRDSILTAFPDSIVLIDSVNVTIDGFTYVDDGSHNNEPLSDEGEYCYFVTAFGSYGNDTIASPLINHSQIICAQPNDTIPPCMPLNFNVSPPDGIDCDDIGCSNGVYTNHLTWSANTMDTCGNDIRHYNIYYSSLGMDGPYTIVGTSIDTVYDHTGLKSFAGCYKISAVDRSGNESLLSEPFCVENCLYYELPNVFTPDNDPDGFNNVFEPFPCPRFVNQVDLKVFNRFGKQVYTFSSSEPENSILIGWNGHGDNGTLLSAGVYYYVADVEFEALDPDLRLQQITGWVHIIY